MLNLGERARWALLGGVLVVGCTRSPEEKFLQAVAEGKGVVPLPAGGLELDAPVTLGPSANGLQIVGRKGDVVRARKGLELRALFLCRECRNVTFRNFAIEGDPEARSRPAEAPPAETELRQYFSGNGIVIEGGQDVTVREITFKELSGFAVLGAFDKGTTVENIEVTDSGTRNGMGRNTGAGGVAFTDGSDRFTLRRSTFKRIYGNGVWVHSVTRGDRSQNGRIEENHFENISRDAVLISRGFQITVRKNDAKMIGFPVDTVNTDLRPPAGVGTEGKVDSSRIEGNALEQVNGRCFDLDGFHDSEVANNSCVNRGEAAVYPNGGYGLYLDNGSAEMRSQMVSIHDNTIEGMPWGGVFVIGAGHRVANNKLLRLNLRGCTAEARDANCLPNAEEPMLARAGIYLGLRAQRPDPADAVVVEGNEISGAGMGSGNCVVFAPQVKPEANTVKNNDCKN